MGTGSLRMQGVAREPEENLRPDHEGTPGQKQLAIVGRSSAEILLAMTDLIVGGGPLPGLFAELTPLLRDLTKCTLVEFAVCDAERNSMVTHFWKLEPETRAWDSSSSVAEETPGGWVWEHQEPVRIPDVVGETRFAKTVAELHSLLNERRAVRERRGVDDRNLGEIDALGAELSAAFAGERRQRRERRSA